MSVFDNHIISKTSREKFYDHLRNWFQDNFYQTWNRWYCNCSYVASEFNRVLFNETDVTRLIFGSFEMYHPWVCLKHEDNAIKLIVYYNTDPSIYVHTDVKIFLQMVFDYEYIH